MSENSIKSPCETFPNEFESKSKKVTETREGYIRAFEDKLSEDRGSQEVLSDRSIAQGLTASSTCSPPLRKAICNPNLAGGSFKRKRKDNLLLSRANTKKPSPKKKKTHQGLGYTAALEKDGMGRSFFDPIWIVWIL